MKTNYASTEVPLTNGSLALQEAQPDFDAFTVERLRRGWRIGEAAWLDPQIPEEAAGSPWAACGPRASTTGAASSTTWGWSARTCWG
jgi:hypothetical protein